LQAGCPSCRPTSSVNALKAIKILLDTVYEIENLASYFLNNITGKTVRTNNACLISSYNDEIAFRRRVASTRLNPREVRRRHFQYEVVLVVQEKPRFAVKDVWLVATERL